MSEFQKPYSDHARDEHDRIFKKGEPMLTHNSPEFVSAQRSYDAREPIVPHLSACCGAPAEQLEGLEGYQVWYCTDCNRQCELEP